MSRPEKWDDGYVRIAEHACRLGATDVEVADMLGVSVRTVYNWRSTKPEFSAALVVGKQSADERVERSLYSRALGYTHDAVKIFNANGAPLVVPYREHVAPDTTACIFWLKNRRPDEWRDKIQQEHTGKDGAALIPVLNVTIGKS